MSVTDIKEKVISQFALKIESLEDEESLKVILDFLSGIGENETDQTNLSKHYENIKKKYGPVLAKLAK